MSVFRPLGKLFQQFLQIQQLSPISTTSHLLACSGGKKPKGKPKCDPVKVVGCAPRARKDCRPIPKERMVCHRLDVPEPSYATCLKAPKRKKRMSECECGIPKLIPKMCIKPKLGISIDGCNPPAPPAPGKCRTRHTKAKPKEKYCDKTDICDPDLKPFKSAGPTTESEMSCPSSITGAGMSCPPVHPGMSCPSTPMTSRVCEPEPLSSPFSTPFRNYSTKCKTAGKPKKKCFESKKTKAKPKSKDLTSPVACTAKDVDGNKCDRAKCSPSFVACNKPRPINQYKCPIRKKKPRLMTSTADVKKRKIIMGYKICKEPKPQFKFSCKPKEEKKVVKKEPTPTRCPCFKPVDLNRSSDKPYCKKMPGAVEPDCNRKGGKRKATCEDKCLD